MNPGNKPDEVSKVHLCATVNEIPTKIPMILHRIRKKS